MRAGSLYALAMFDPEGFGGRPRPRPGRIQAEILTLGPGGLYCIIVAQGIPPPDAELRQNIARQSFLRLGLKNSALLCGSSTERTMAGEPESGRSGKAIILVVERDPHVRDLEEHFLNRAGFVVRFEKDGNGALAQARKIVPDIVISEILVPVLDGLTLCRQLKADPLTRNTSVLIFSILAAAERAREAGADGFLLKPLAEGALVGMVQQLLLARNTLAGAVQNA